MTKKHKYWIFFALIQFLGLSLADPVYFSPSYTTYTCDLVTAPQTVGGLWQFEIVAKDADNLPYPFDDLTFRGNLTLLSVSENSRNLEDINASLTGRTFDTIRSISYMNDGKWLVSFSTTVAGIHQLMLEAKGPGDSIFSTIGPSCNITAIPGNHAHNF